MNWMWVTCVECKRLHSPFQNVWCWCHPSHGDEQ